MRRFLLTCLAVLVGSTAAVVAAPSATAAPAGWAAFSFATATGVGTMQQRPTGFPAAEIVSNSATGGGVGLQSGATTFLPPQSPPAREYGSSQGAGYLNLRAAGRTTAQSSLTTYRFARPTPASGWTFVLGDIDADQVTITATDADGAPVDAADLGFRGTFNYCAPGVTPKPACTPPLNHGSFLPTWNPSTAVLLGDTPQFRDTAGASAWFEPRVALSTLTFDYALQRGTPVYQTWFSALQFDVTGSVAAPAGRRGGIELQLLDPEGNPVATTRTADDGSYAFEGLASYDNWRVALVLPDGLAPAPGQELTEVADLGDGDAVVDFALRAVVGRSVGGAVTYPNGDPVPGVSLTLTGSGLNREVVTDADGRYLIDDIPAGTGYSVSATAPSGTTVSSARTFDVPADSDPPDQDFVLTPAPLGSLRGRVTLDGSGDPVPNALVVVSGPDGERDVRTDEDGTWLLEDLGAGTYTVTVRPEGGATVVGRSSLTATLTAAGEDRTGLSFELAPAPVERQTASGTVTDEDGKPVAKARITAVDPYDGETFSATSDEDGNWTIRGLYPDRGWTFTIRPPKGYEVTGADSVVVDLLADVSDIDFVLARIARPTPSTEPVEAADGGLADTGGPPVALGVIGLLLVGSALRLRGRRGRDG